jgi:FAD/FMN-containing dehydrogenase
MMPTDSARSIHNGMIDRHPALIVRCAGVADVLAAVTCARTHNLVVAVRGGGHGVPGFAVCDGGVMIDLSRMNSVRVDPVARTARAEGGGTWGDFDHETQAFDLATTGGIARPTGIAGLTLGGGHGYLMRTYGLACDNLLSVDVVTADGLLLTASATAHADLFWAVRGGGGNFGVVTAFEYQLYPVSQLLGGLLLYPITHAHAVFASIAISPGPPLRPWARSATWRRCRMAPRRWWSCWPTTGPSRAANASCAPYGNAPRCWPIRLAHCPTWRYKALWKILTHQACATTGSRTTCGISVTRPSMCWWTTILPSLPRTRM